MGLLDKALEEMHDDPVPWMHLLAQAKRSLGYELYDAGKHFCQLLYFPLPETPIWHFCHLFMSTRALGMAVYWINCTVYIAAFFTMFILSQKEAPIQCFQRPFNTMSTILPVRSDDSQAG